MGFIRKEIGEREKKLLEDFSIEEKELATWFGMRESPWITLTRTVKSIVSNSRAIMPSLFSMKSTISTASCSTTVLMKKTHLQSKTACW